MISVRTQTTAMVGIATGQTARLSVLNPGGAPRGGATGQTARVSVDAPPGFTCSAEVVFKDQEGKTIKYQLGAVQPGKSCGFDLSADNDLSLADGARIQFRVMLTSLSADPTPPTNPPTTISPLCNVIPTL